MLIFPTADSITNTMSSLNRHPAWGLDWFVDDDIPFGGMMYRPMGHMQSLMDNMQSVMDDAAYLRPAGSLMQVAGQPLAGQPDLAPLRNADERALQRRDQPHSAGFKRCRVDISENDKEIAISAELPGMELDQVKVAYDQDSSVMAISGETSRDAEDQGEKDGYSWSRQERSYGKFRRSFQLPLGCEPSNMTATMNKGILQIQVPKPTPVSAPKEESHVVSIPISQAESQPK